MNDKDCSISERCFRAPLKAAVCSSSRDRFNRARHCFPFFVLLALAVDLIVLCL